MDSVDSIKVFFDVRGVGKGETVGCLLWEMSRVGLERTQRTPMFPQSSPLIPYGGFSPVRLEVWSSTGCPSIRGCLTPVQRSPGHSPVSRRW